MDHLVIDGVRPYDGRYEFDLVNVPFSTTEFGWIKRFSNYLPLTFMDGWRGADAELMVVFAIIALARAGKIGKDEAPDVWERFGDAPGVTAVRIELGNTEKEEDASPPPSPPSSSVNGGSSGPDSKTSSETSAVDPNTSGIPVSDSSGSA